MNIWRLSHCRCLMLRATSCLIGTVVVHAYHLRLDTYHHLFLCVTIFSILFHCTQIALIRVADKILAHAAFLFIIGDSLTAVRTGNGWLLGFPTTVLVCWFGQSLFTQARNQLHVLLHLATIIGLHCYMHTLYGTAAIQ